MSIKIKLLLTTLCSLLITIAQAETIKIGVGDHYPPFIINDNLIVGFEVDLANAICEEINLECEIIQHPFDELFPMLQKKDISIIMSGVVLNKELEAKADASRPYVRDSARFLKLKSNNTNFALNSLKDKKVGIKLGSPYHKYLLENYPNGLNIIEYNRTADLIEALHSTEVDFIFASGLYFEYNYVNKPSFSVEFFGPEIQNEKFFGDGLAAYFTKDSEKQLKENFNTAIKKLRASKRFQKISQKYFNKDVFKE